MRRIFLLDFKRGFLSPGFYVGVLLLVLAAIFGMGEMLDSVAAGSLPEGEMRFLSAACLALSCKPLTYILPVASTLAVSGAYMEERQCGLTYYVALRTTKRRYHLSKWISCVLFGILSVVVAAVILLIVFAILFVPEKSELQNFQIASLTYFIQRVLLLCLNSSFYGVLGAALSICTNNQYMAYAAPFILYYVLSTMGDAYLHDYPLLSPREWMIGETSLLFYNVLILFLGNVIVGVFDLKIMERRWNHE